jgi:hypothetical protein
VYVDVGIDSGSTSVSTTPGGDLPDGRERVCIRFTPRDRFGNYLGPGRGGSLTVEDQPGSDLDGPLIDHGDGSYTQCVAWDPDSGEPPGISVGQTGRPGVVVQDRERRIKKYSVKVLCGRQHGPQCCEASVRPGTYATEIQLYNASNKPARVRKRVLPLTVAGATVGREPDHGRSQHSDTIVLPPRSATMDDCCRIADLVPGVASGFLFSGLLEILSSQELVVTAAYTATGSSGRVDIDTLRVQAP